MSGARDLARVSEPRERLTAQQQKTFEKYLEEIFSAFGLELGSASTMDTPRRFLEALAEATSGYEPDPKLVTLFALDDTDDRPEVVEHHVVEGRIPFSAICEHHALPFFGHVDLGYVPGGQIIGLSKLT